VTPNRLPQIALLIDAAFVVAFALIGRVSHGESVLGVPLTAWPFLAGLVGGWVLLRAWRSPLHIVWTGLGVWAITVGIGFVLRLASGQGVQLPFLIVTTIVLGVFLLGWRAAALLGVRSRSRRAGNSVGADVKRMPSAA